MADRDRRTSSRKRDGGDLTRGDYLGLTLLVTVALVGTAVFLAYLLERRGMLSDPTALGGLLSSEPGDEMMGGVDGAGEPGTSP